MLACSGECLFPRVVGAPTKGESMEVLVLRYVGAFWALLLTCFSSACPLVVNRPPCMHFIAVPASVFAPRSWPCIVLL